jgi:hypothetical protein
MPADPWGAGTVFQNDARLSGRDVKEWLVLKKLKGWVLLVGLRTGWAHPPTKKMRQREFDFMVQRGAYRYIRKVNLRTRKMQDMIKAIIDQEFPELVREMEDFYA